MKRAHLRDAVRTQMFHFRRHIAPPVDPCCGCPSSAAAGTAATASASSEGTDSKIPSTPNGVSTGATATAAGTGLQENGAAGNNNNNNDNNNNYDSSSRNPRALSNTEKYIATAIAAEVAGSPCKVGLECDSRFVVMMVRECIFKTWLSLRKLLLCVCVCVFYFYSFYSTYFEQCN